MEFEKYDLTKLRTSRNIAEMLGDEECRYLGADVVDAYAKDKSAREQWETDHAEAMKLSLQVAEEKSEPWEGASNIKFPLVTVAALQWHARAYPLLIKGPDVVKCRVIGEDPSGIKTRRAQRVSAHMSWQLLEEDERWEEEHDKTLLVMAIMGCAFKKSYYDPVARKNRSILVKPQDLIVNYWCKDEVNAAPRATHYIPFSRNEVHERIIGGKFLQYDDEGKKYVQQPDDSAMEQAVILREGVEKPPVDDVTPIVMLEQLCWYDLDGDGYAEPYIATVEQQTNRLRRLVARFTKKDVTLTGGGEVIRIDPQTIYTKYGLIPAPDGGFYDLGFGRLLGPLNYAVDTLINQTIDTGTLANYGGGFMGRGARFKNGDNSFKPGEWKNVESTGDDLRKNLVPLPVRDPSKILIELAQMLISYGERVANTNDVQMGENPGQNTPAETTRTMNENGQRVLAATIKRTWRSTRNEIRVLYNLNRIHIQDNKEFENLSTGKGALVLADDYLMPATDVRPAADPTIVSKEQQRQMAQMLVQNAMSIPGHNKYRSIHRLYEVLDVPNIDEVFPPPKPPKPQPGQPPQQVSSQDLDIPTPPNPKLLEVQIKAGQLKLDEQAQKFDQQQATIELKQAIMETQATIMEKQAKAMKLIAEAKGIESESQLAMLEIEIKAHKVGLDALLKAAEVMQKQFEGNSSGQGNEGGNDGGPGAAPGMATAPNNAALAGPLGS